jgi:hypothetical protein
MPECVEIKINLGEDQVREAQRRWGLRRRDAESIEIWFGEYLYGEGEAATLSLIAHDLILRVRRRPDGTGDATVKLRVRDDQPLPSTLPPIRKGPNGEFKVEGDWAGTGRNVSASAVAFVRSGLPGRMTSKALGAVWRPKQLAFLRQAVDLPIDPRALQVLGPVQALRWKHVRLAGLDQDVAVERWTFDERRFLELSILVREAEAREAQRQFTAWLADQGLDPAALQKPKTSLVLEHFARKLTA